jgi:hypothetical protein
MSFPTSAINTTNLTTGASDPSQARADILAAIESLNQIIEGAGLASGVLLLTGSGLIPGNKLPSQIALPAGVQVINPTSGIVNIRDVLRMQSTADEDILALADPQAGDIVFSTEQRSLVIYTGTAWKILDLDSAETLTAVTVDLDAEFTLTAEADNE